jgi:hypothetical protein
MSIVSAIVSEAIRGFRLTHFGHFGRIVSRLMPRDLFQQFVEMRGFVVAAEGSRSLYEFFRLSLIVFGLHADRAPMQHFTVYIDEAGDEGFGKLAAGPVGGQSRWLVLGAAIVSRENDLKLPQWRDQILSRFPIKKTRDLHFRDLKHEQKIVACQEISRLPVGACVAMSHKVTIPGSKYEKIFKQKGYLYNYLVRWLLERVTSVCFRKSQPDICAIKIVFSRRGGTNYQSMIEYFNLMKNGNEVMRPARRIVWPIIDFYQIAVENHSKWAGLQVSDCMTSALFSAVEPNTYGNYEHSYASILKPRLIKENGRSLNCGITAVPSRAACGLDRQQDEFFKLFQ